MLLFRVIPGYDPGSTPQKTVILSQAQNDIKWVRHDVKEERPRKWGLTGFWRLSPFFAKTGILARSMPG